VLYTCIFFSMLGVLEDLRYGLRALVKHPGFAVVAIFSLALGIGANTTIFSLVHAILLRPLPVADPASLLAVNTVDAHNPGYLLVSYPNYKDFRDRNQVFSSLLLYSNVPVNLTGLGEPRPVIAQLVTANYFRALGVNPVVGRALLPEEDQSPGAAPVAVVSYNFWQRQLAADSQVLSRTLEINRHRFRIVGVAPRGFEGLDEMALPELWVPSMMYEAVYPYVSLVNQRRALLFAVAGRLKPGVTAPQAEAEMQSLAAELDRQYPQDNDGRRIQLMPVLDVAINPRNRPAMEQAGLVLLIISSLVLLIACANVANLLLARAAGRRKEITVRLALGASRWRLVRQLLTESVALSLIGGAAGLLLARWSGDLLWSMRPPMFKRAAIHVDLDQGVLIYTAALSLLTGILFSLVPALRATRSDLATDLKERTGQSPARPGGRWHPRSILVMAQVALSVVALVGAGLFVRSLRNAARFDPGFDAAHLGIVVFNLADQAYTEARGREYQRRAIELALATPGVAAAAISKDVPFRVSLARTILREGVDAPGTKGRFTLTGIVTPAYLPAVGIPILRGRDFSPQDRSTSPRVVIVNEVAAAAYWPGEDPIGKRIQFYGENVPVEVIGVARTANYRAIGEKPDALIYISMEQYYFPMGVLYLRTAGDPEAVAVQVRRAMQTLDPNLYLQSEALEQTTYENLWAQRLSAALLAVFGLLALLLSTIGIYGVISYLVHQRAREIGVRMALGATSGEVQRMILVEGVRMVAVGVVAGTAVALAAARSVKSMLFVISPRDAATFVLVPSILALVAVIACWVPALRATRVDPAVALRDE
jgi:predicted permease